MVHLLSTRCHLTNLAQRVAKYLKNCPGCCKLARHTGPPPLLLPLPVPDSPWRDISGDFLGLLPTSDGFNMIMLNGDRLTKMRHYMPRADKEADRGTSAPGMARLYLDHVCGMDGLPDTIVLDRGSQFITAIWVHLTSSLGIKRKLSTAYHPQTDGQIGVANQDLENYQLQYVWGKHDNWALWRSVAEFASNSAPSATTSISPFHAFYWYELYMDVDNPAGEPGSLTHFPSKHLSRSQVEAFAASFKET